MGEVKACLHSRALLVATAMALAPFGAVEFPQSIFALSCFRDLPCAALETSLVGLGRSLIPKATDNISQSPIQAEQLLTGFNCLKVHCKGEAASSKQWFLKKAWCYKSRARAGLAKTTPSFRDIISTPFNISCSSKFNDVFHFVPFSPCIWFLLSCLLQ